MRFLLKRVFFYVIAAWASLTINFFLPRLMPGDAATAIFTRFRGQLNPAALEAMKKAYGVSDDPVMKQYVVYLWNIMHGEFGVSISYFPTPVTEVVRSAFGWTLLLGMTALLISFAIGTVLGIFGAWHRGRFIDRAVPPFMMFFGSFPYFWLATLSLYFLSYRYTIFPLMHAYDGKLTPGWNMDYIVSVIYHLILPASTMILVAIGGWLLGIRNSMIAVLSEDFVMMAEAKGLSERRVMFNYAARNALLPTVTSFGMSIGFILGGALLTEIVFSYPGLGYRFLTAVQSKDYPLIQALFLMVTIAVLVANFIVDIVYVFLDPRART